MNRIKKWILPVAVFIVIYLIITTSSICIYAEKDEKYKCDAAIVLGASVTSQGVSPVFRERLNHGIWLYENDYVDYLIVTGGVGEGNITSEARIAKEYLLSNHIPEEIIFLEEESTITQENILFSKEIMVEKDLQTAIVVSDPLHMRRAMLMAEDYEIEAYSSPTPTTMYRSWKTKLPFLCREEFYYVGYRIYRMFHEF